MKGSRLFQRVTARREPLSGDELADPRLEVDLWEAVVRDREVASRLVAFLTAHPTLLDLEVPAFARAITSVPGLEAGLAGQVLAVFALRGHIERLAGLDSRVGRDLERNPGENGATESPRSASSGEPRGLAPSENVENPAHEGESDDAGGVDGGAAQGAEPA